MRHPSRHRAAGALAAMALVLTACGADGVMGGGSPRSGTVRELLRSVPEADRPGARPCDTVESTLMTATVTGQLDALAAGDFAAAHAWASTTFRAGVGPQAFEQLIRTGYPELLGSAMRRVEGCQVLDGRGTLIIGITARSGARRVIGYRLTEDVEGWRIDGAGDVMLRRGS